MEDRVWEALATQGVRRDDPATWTAPWTVMIPLKETGEEIFEYACHEGNYGMEGILSGHRAAERAMTAQTATGSE